MTWNLRSLDNVGPRNETCVFCTANGNLRNKAVVGYTAFSFLISSISSMVRNCRTKKRSRASSTPQGKIGEMVRVGDVGITVIQIERVTQVDTAKPPRPDTVFVAVELMVESQTRAGVYVNPLFARLQDDASNVYNIVFVGREPFLETRVNLPMGEKTQG